MSAATPDPRYPIGVFAKPGTLTPSERAALADRIGALPAALRSAVRGLSAEQLDTPYRDHGWTVREVVHHVGDSHANALTRFKLALTEERPTVRPYDENAWLHTADIAATSVEQALEYVDEIHRRIHALARVLTAEQGARRLLHPESGELTLDDLLANYAWHGDHHVAHITALRTARGWTQPD